MFARYPPSARVIGSGFGGHVITSDFRKNYSASVHWIRTMRPAIGPSKTEATRDKPRLSAPDSVAASGFIRGSSSVITSNAGKAPRIPKSIAPIGH